MSSAYVPWDLWPAVLGSQLGPSRPSQRIGHGFCCEFHSVSQHRCRHPAGRGNPLRWSCCWAAKAVIRGWRNWSGSQCYGLVDPWCYCGNLRCLPCCSHGNVVVPHGGRGQLLDIQCLFCSIARAFSSQAASNSVSRPSGRRTLRASSTDCCSRSRTFIGFIQRPRTASYLKQTCMFVATSMTWHAQHRRVAVALIEVGPGVGVDDCNKGTMRQTMLTRCTQNCLVCFSLLGSPIPCWHCFLVVPFLWPPLSNSPVIEHPLRVASKTKIQNVTSKPHLYTWKALVKTTVFAGSAILHKKWLGGLFPPAAFLLAVKIVLGTHPADHKPVQTSLQHFEARLKQHFFRVQQRSDTILMMQGEAFELDLLQKLFVMCLPLHAGSMASCFP